jgi:hypothetical protein
MSVSCWAMTDPRVWAMLGPAMDLKAWAGLRWAFLVPLGVLLGITNVLLLIPLLQRLTPILM